MTFPGGKGHYEFGVYGGGYGNEDTVGQFQLSCSGHGSSTVLYDREIEYGSISVKDALKRYEIYANETGTMIVNLIPCGGKVSLEISDDY